MKTLGTILTIAACAWLLTGDKPALAAPMAMPSVVLAEEDCTSTTDRTFHNISCCDENERNPATEPLKTCAKRIGQKNVNDNKQAKCDAFCSQCGGTESISVAAPVDFTGDDATCTKATYGDNRIDIAWTCVCNDDTAAGVTPSTSMIDNLMEGL